MQVDSDAGVRSGRGRWNEERKIGHETDLLAATRGGLHVVSLTGVGLRCNIPQLGEHLCLCVCEWTCVLGSPDPAEGSLCKY